MRNRQRPKTIRQRYAEIGDLNQGIIICDALTAALQLKREVEAQTGYLVALSQNLSTTATMLKYRSFAFAVCCFSKASKDKREILHLLGNHNIRAIITSADPVLQERSSGDAGDPNEEVYRGGEIVADRRLVVRQIKELAFTRDVSLLIVDDSDASIIDMKRILAPYGFAIFTARSGKNALEILSGNAGIDIVITDYYMPDIDGYELTLAIRSKFGLDEVRVIGISASSDRHLSATFLHAGASDFIYRPFAEEEFRCRILNNVETIRHLSRLKDLAERDGLTRLFNRRAFFEKVEDMAERGATILVDLDDFKAVNDSHGHDAGDHVLTVVAGLLRGYADHHDAVVGRLGGEEFAIVFPPGVFGAQLEICQSLLEDIRQTPVVHKDAMIYMTASMGMVGFEPGSSIDQQLSIADKLLYMAKEQGRNKLVWLNDGANGVST